MLHAFGKIVKKMYSYKKRFTINYCLVTIYREMGNLVYTYEEQKEQNELRNRL